ncbi:MAG: indole-3-glycerol phosphate synthase TrpC, partial [Spirochaetota bacterium]
ENEIERALVLSDAAVGVNARDLRDFSVSLERTALLRKMIPDGRTAVGESGIMCDADAVKLVKAGYDALLIGEYFITSIDRASAVKGIVDAVGMIGK